MMAHFPPTETLLSLDWIQVSRDTSVSKARSDLYYLVGYVKIGICERVD